MAGFGLRRPGVSALIAGAISAAGLIGIVAGIYDMNAQGRETALSSIGIGAGIVVAVLGAAVLVNFLRGIRAVNRIKRGVAVIARWTVTPSEVEAFRADEDRRKAARDVNDYRLPKRIPPEGIPVVFADDAVMVGDTYFALVSKGMFTFDGVEVLADRPRAIQFGTRSTTLADTGTSFSIRTSVGVLRVPVANAATEELKVVARHFLDVLNGQKIVNPSFYPSRIRMGLIAAVVFGILAAIGFGMEAVNPDFEPDWLPLVLAVVGVIGALGGLVLAWLANAMRGNAGRGPKTRV